MCFFDSRLRHLLRRQDPFSAGIWRRSSAPFPAGPRVDQSDASSPNSVNNPVSSDSGISPSKRYSNRTRHAPASSGRGVSKSTSAERLGLEVEKNVGAVNHDVPHRVGQRPGKRAFVVPADVQPGQQTAVPLRRQGVEFRRALRRIAPAPAFAAGYRPPLPAPGPAPPGILPGSVCAPAS